MPQTPHALDVGSGRLELARGDITHQATDAIVNAANSSLLGGGGVDGAIHRAGGPGILEECRLIREREWPRGLPPGGAVLTGGGRLAARHVIHTVGPIWRGGAQHEAETLARCYRNCLALAERHALVSLAFPSISTGAYGYPTEQAARVALFALQDGMTNARSLRLVRFALWSDADLGVYARALLELAASRGAEPD
jgi:O-acetyl-ADP-ribose deacetylase (regulator of RNase III)